jgi:hypothetical protein
MATSTQVSHQNREVVIRYGYLGNTSTQIMLDLYGHLYEDEWENVIEYALSYPIINIECKGYIIEPIADNLHYVK